MSRKARIDAPGALHHVIARGIDRRFRISQPAVSSAVRKGEKIVKSKDYKLLET